MAIVAWLWLSPWLIDSAHHYFAGNIVNRYLRTVDLPSLSSEHYAGVLITVESQRTIGGLLPSRDFDRFELVIRPIPGDSPIRILGARKEAPSRDDIIALLEKEQFPVRAKLSEDEIDAIYESLNSLYNNMGAPSLPVSVVNIYPSLQTASGWSMSPPDMPLPVEVTAWALVVAVAIVIGWGVRHRVRKAGASDTDAD